MCAKSINFVCAICQWLFYDVVFFVCLLFFHKWTIHQVYVVSAWFLLNAKVAISWLTSYISIRCLKARCFVLTNAMRWLFIVSTYKKPTPRINMPLQSDTLSCFRANQSLLLLLNAVCLVGKQQIQVLQSLFDPTGVQNTINHTRGEHACHYTNPSMRVFMAFASKTHLGIKVYGH
jgi:hypothetical protein